MRKKLCFCISALLIIIAVLFTLSACQTTPPEVNLASEGLDFWLDEESDTYEVSLGEAEELHIIIPAVFNGKAVTKISEDGFKSSAINKIDIPSSVTTIGRSAFADCTSLTEIVIPEGVEVIEREAFKGCKSLFSVSMADSVTVSQAYSFSDCTALRVVGLSNSLEVISDSMFLNCSSLEFVEIPASVKEIEKLAFKNCTSLTRIDIPATVQKIGASVYGGCRNISEISIPFVGNQIKTSNDKNQYPLGYIFGSEAYDAGRKIMQTYHNTKDDVVTNRYFIPHIYNVTVYGGNILFGAFDECFSIQTITLEEGVKRVEGLSGISDLYALRWIILPKSLEYVDCVDFCAFVDLICFNGTKEEWEMIEKRDFNNSSYYPHFYSEVQPPDDGYKYWHYVGGEPAAW